MQKHAWPDRFLAQGVIICSTRFFVCGAYTESDNAPAQKKGTRDYENTEFARRGSRVMATRPGETNDLASLTHLNEAILLDELKARYKKDDIYVRIV